MRIGLIGFPVAHSKSPLMQGAAFKQAGLDWVYELWHTLHDEVAARVQMIREHDDIAGANVTVPHKLNVMPYLDDISPHAQAIGAVNTIVKTPTPALRASSSNGAGGTKLRGDNTDWIGFLNDVQWHGVDVTTPNHALVLGAGGSARAVVYALLHNGWDVTIVNRNPAKAMNLAGDMRKIFEHTQRGNDGIYFARELNDYITGAHALVVNCTSAGMEPHDDTSPWPAELPFPQNAVLYDLVYKPRVTKLMRQAEASGARAIGGIGMLAEQGAVAFELWTGVAAASVAGVMRETIE
jgi:shikimate dehydrogenase